MAPYWGQSFGNPHSSDHAVGWEAHRAVEHAAASVAALIGADTDEIVFTSGATEANNLALFGVAGRAPRESKRILVSAIEHKCVLAASRAIAERSGISVEIVPVDHEGMIDLTALEAALSEDVLLVSVMAVNNEVGAIQDIPRISDLLGSKNIPFHCDAAQAPCAIDMCDFANRADMISLSAHKIHGPQGIGALYIRRNFQSRIEPMIYGGGQQNGLRSGTLPLPLCIGMGSAAGLVAEGAAAAERARVARQRNQFVALLRDGGTDVILNGPQTDRRHPGNASLRFTGYEADWILGSLQPELAASTGSACTSGAPERSHVLRAIGLSEAESDASIRFSFGRFTTDDEICKAAKLVLNILKEN